jgi:hypothetical protein
MRAVLLLAFAAAVSTALVSSALGFSPSAAKSPSAATVDAALGMKDKGPTSSVTPYAKICTYNGGVLPTKVTFQEDTAATFAASEKAVGSMLVKVSGLGKGAWTTQAGGDLQVFNGSETLKILAPGVAAAKLEGLARKISGF